MSWLFSPLAIGEGILATSNTVVEVPLLAISQSVKSVTVGYVQNTYVTPSLFFNANGPGNLWNVYNKSLDNSFNLSVPPHKHLATNFADNGMPNSSDTFVNKLVIRFYGRRPSGTGDKITLNLIDNDGNVKLEIGETPTLTATYASSGFITVTAAQLKLALDPTDSNPNILATSNFRNLHLGFTSKTTSDAYLYVGSFSYNMYLDAPNANAVLIPSINFAQDIPIPTVSVVVKPKDIVLVPSLAITESLLLPNIKSNVKEAIPLRAINQALLLPNIISNARELVPRLSVIQTLPLPNVKNSTNTAVEVPLLSITQTVNNASTPALSSSGVIAPTNLTSFVEGGGAPQYAWVNPNNVKVLDNQFAYVTLERSLKTPYLTFSLAELGIPASPDVKINSIEVKLVCKNNTTFGATAQARIFSSTNFASNIGTIVTADLGSSTSVQTITLKGNFGLTEIQKQGNNFSNYRIGISAETSHPNGNTFFVDSFTVKVLYEDNRILENTIVAVNTLSILESIIIPALNEKNKEPIPKLSLAQSLLVLVVNAGNKISIPKLNINSSYPVPIAYGKEAVLIPTLTVLQSLPAMDARVIQTVTIPTLNFTQSCKLPVIKAQNQVSAPVLNINQTINLINTKAQNKIATPVLNINQTVFAPKIDDKITVPKLVLIEVIQSVFTTAATRIPVLNVIEEFSIPKISDNIKVPSLNFNQAILSTKISDLIQVGPLQILQTTYSVLLPETLIVPNLDINQSYGDIKIDDLIKPLTLAISQDFPIPDPYTDIIPVWYCTISWNNFVVGPDGKHALMKFYSETDKFELTGRSMVKLPTIPTSVSYIKDIQDA